MYMESNRYISVLVLVLKIYFSLCTILIVAFDVIFNLPTFNKCNVYIYVFVIITCAFITRSFPAKLQSASALFEVFSV